MDIFRVRSINKIKQSGQSTVEYILLFAVVAVLANFVFQSEQFRSLFGDEGRFANVFKRQMEYSYRHGLEGSTPFTTPNYRNADHDSYKGRFFGAIEPYPQ